MNQSRRLTEGAMFIALFFVLMLASFIPVLSAFVIVLMPIPFVIYTARHGLNPGLLVLAVATLITVLFFTVFSLPLTLLMGAGGLSIGYAMYKKRTPYETWAHGILGFIFGLLFSVAFMQLVFDVNFASEFESIAEEQMQIYASLIESMGGADPEIDIETVFQEQVQLFLTLMPAFLAFAAIGLAFLAQWISYKVINRVDKENYVFPPFREFKLPTSILWLYLIVIFISFVDLDPSSVFYVGIHNALTILEMLLVVQGFSFIFFYAHHKNMSKALPIISIIITVLFPVFLLYFIRILGIIDIGLNLKDRMKQNKQNRK